MSASEFNPIRRSLLGWYRQSRRDLPWRRSSDPYAIWIAETMLQQTQVKTVLPYYSRFLKEFPTVEALDRAPRERVLALWSGLGYYRRAEDLKKAARKIVRHHGGKIPRSFAALRELPGVGLYTAGALMSIAFNRPYPALDGNARRVLTRLFDLQGEKDLYALGQRLVSPSRPGPFNQALMELGSRVCVAKEPRCPLCPLSRSCAARRSGSFKNRALPARGRRMIEVEWPLAVIQNGGRILLRRRAREGILKGLWEVPGGEKKRGESLRAALARHLNGIGERLKIVSPVGEIRHAITHRKIRAPLFVLNGAALEKTALHGARWRWLALSSLHRYPLSSLSLKAVKAATRR